MNITKLHIENFKTFKGSFELTLNKGVNILVGNNEAGKSTIIEAIHLALKKQDILSYLQKFNPMQLRDSKRTNINHNFRVVNFGGGEGFVF